MPEQSQVPEKERFNLKIDAELLAEIEAEANEKSLSTTAYIVETLKNRKAVAEAANASTLDLLIRGLRLCPECAERLRMYDVARPGIMLQSCRHIVWNAFGTWEHGKFDEGCPGWESKADAADIQKYRDRLAEEWLSASV